MPETVTIREKLKLIHVESSGDIGVDDLRGSLAEILKFHQERGFTRVLVDATKQESMPETMPVFEFGEAVSAALGSVKIAIAHSPRTWEKIQYFITVARQRGAHVQAFDTIDEARKWLLRGGGPADATASAPGHDG